MPQSDPKIILGISLGEFQAGLAKAGGLVKDFKKEAAQSSRVADAVASAIAAIGGEASLAGKAISHMAAGFALGGPMGLAIGAVQSIIGAFRELGDEEKKATEEAKKQAKERKDAYERAAEALYKEQTELAKKRYVSAGGKAEDFDAQQASNEDLALQRAQYAVNLSKEKLKATSDEMKVQGYSNAVRIKALQPLIDELRQNQELLRVEEERYKTAVRSASVTANEAAKKEAAALAEKEAESRYKALTILAGISVESAKLNNLGLAAVEQEQLKLTILELEHEKLKAITAEEKAAIDAQIAAARAASAERVRVGSIREDTSGFSGYEAEGERAADYTRLKADDYKQSIQANVDATKEWAAAFADLGQVAGASLGAMIDGQVTLIDAMKSVISHIIQTIAQLMIQVQVETALAAVRAAGSAAWTPVIGPILAISAAAAVMTGLLTYKPKGRQFGGPVGAGVPYIVGEIGPELFVPSSAGSIVPHDKLPTGGTFNIFALDAKSFEQYLGDNRLALVRTLRGAAMDRVFG